MPMLSGKLEVTYINIHNDIGNLPDGLVRYCKDRSSVLLGEGNYVVKVRFLGN